ncbi:MAG: glycine betaine ABC transporter substrate-binding protein [Rubrobacteraceae bacterium]
MRKTRSPHKAFSALTLTALLALTLALAGCGGQGPGTSGGGSIAEEFDLSGPQATSQFTVGSEDFTEQEVLGQISIQALEAAGADVTDETGLGGNAAVRQALLDDDISLYWEYTATGWLVFLANTNPISDPQEQYDAVAEQDLEENDVEWLQPAPANNTYTIVSNPDTARDLGVENITDLARLVEENPEEATLCFGNENDFQSRVDGLPGLEQAYGFEFPSESLIITPLDTVYEFVAQGDRCNFGVAFLTSGLLEEQDLEIIEDDENFFAVYNPAPTMKAETLQENPQLENLFAPIAEKLDTETLRGLNSRVEVDGESPDAVAGDWLRENGFTG